MVGNRPIKKWRAANFEVAVWSNKRKTENGEIEFKTASLSRSYKKKDEDIWRSEVLNFRRLDIPKIQTLISKVQEELYLTQEESKEEADEND